MSRVLVGVVMALSALAGCSTASSDDEDVRTAGIYEAILRWAFDTEGLRPAEDGDLPIIYVVASDGDSASPEVQVEVVKELMEEADIRFTDARDDALELDEEGQPVIDGGLLVVIGTVPPEGLLVEVGADLYWAEDESRAYVIRLAGSGERWNVTNESLVE